MLARVYDGEHFWCISLLIWVRLEVQQCNQTSSKYKSSIHRVFPCPPVGECELGLCLYEFQTDEITRLK